MPRRLLSDPEAWSHLMHCVSILRSHFGGNQQRRSSRWRPDRAQPLQAVLGCSYPRHASLHGNEDWMHHHEVDGGARLLTKDWPVVQRTGDWRWDWESPFARWSEELRLPCDAEGSAEEKKTQLIRCCCRPCSSAGKPFSYSGACLFLAPSKPFVILRQRWMQVLCGVGLCS